MQGGMMSFSASRPRLIFYGLAVLLLLLPLAARGQQTGGAEKMEVPSLSPEALPKILAEATAALQEKLGESKSWVADSGKKLAEEQARLSDLQVSVAAVKAAMAVKRLSLVQVQELLVAYGTREAELKARTKDLTREIEETRKAREAEIVSQNTLRGQIGIIQAQEPAVAALLSQTYLDYLQLADQRDQLTREGLNHLEQRLQVLETEKQLVAGLQPQLQILAETWEAELLKRPAQAIPWQEQIAQIWADLAALPARAWHWFMVLVSSGVLAGFFRDHLTHLVGLLAFIILMWRSVRWLVRQVQARFSDWRRETKDLSLLPLYVLGQVFINHLWLLGWVLGVGLFLWTFGMLGSTPGQVILYFLGAFWMLRLTTCWVQEFFAGKGAGGVLPLAAGSARFYRRALKFFLVYLFLGLFGLKTAALTGFPEASRLFLEHFFLVGLLVLVLWLMRPRPLAHLLPVLPDPAWIHHPGVAVVLRGLVLSILAVTILADLLNFQNLAVYLAQAATWSLLSLAVLWFLWLAGARVIYHLLHPEAGWAKRRYRAQREFLQRVYLMTSWLLSIVLGIGVVLGSLAAWGIKPERVAWAFQWITWGPVLGPVKLTVLNVGGAALAIYLGLWLSRIVRGLIQARIFPRTALDSGVQYTISTTVHYVVLFLAALISLNILGFPLTNLALVAGALGVGIGFGLQNIVNNFLSGLILLFERPIKVGDLLVIDGKWGTVKEIRVRSTVFETSDKAVLIIPNSELVSQKVLNWTHYGRGINRLTLKVGVGCNSDVRQVTQLITDVCLANPRVVAEPAPQVYFSAYGESTLNFTIWVHLKTPGDRVPATHELNRDILEAFQQHGIDTPFPQLDLHIKDWPGPPGKEGKDNSS